jgi:hypothetical protein
MSTTALKIIAAALALTLLPAGVATAHGGGAAMTMPTVSYSDLPPYHPRPVCGPRHGCGHHRFYPQVRR